jgi:uncharacterized repeat protein (TIGR01451 family)
MRGMNRNFATAFVLLISLGYPAKSGAVDFASPVSYPVGTSPSAVVVGDFNGDGKPDIAVANSGSANVSVLLGNGDGTFKDALNSSAGPLPLALAVGDFNGDHKLDLIVISPGDTTTSTVGVANLLLGKGDGTFQPPVKIAAGQSPFSVAAEDLNGDKKIDLVFGDQSDESLSVLLGNGDGTFQPARTISLGSSGQISSLVVADFNGDTNPDVVAATPTGAVILAGHGDGTFQATGPVVASTSGGFLLAGDFDNDQRVDLVGLARIPPPSGCHEFCVSPFSAVLYRGNGDGTFNPGVLVGSAFSSHSANFVAADFNADNNLDLFMEINRFGTLLLGAGNGISFLVVPPIESVAGAILSFAAVADFNGDSLPDLALTDNLNNSVTVVLNTGPSSGADLALTLDPAQANGVLVGADLSYSVTIFSEGPQDASSVVLTESLPAGLKHVSVQPGQGTCTGTTTITCDLGAMPDPSAATVQFTVTPTAAGTFTDAVVVAATQPDLNSRNNSASITITVVQPADLSVSATASKTTAMPGDKVTVSVNVSNSGPGTATNVTLDDSVTDSTQVSNMTISSGRCTMSTGQLICTTGTLASGANVTMTYIVTAGTSGFDNNLNISSDQLDVNTNNNSASVSIAVSDFTVSPEAANLIVKRGGQASEVLTFPAQGGFSGTIALTCSVSGPSPMPGCGISPASVTPGANATLTINAGALTAALTPRSFERAEMLYAAWLPLGLLGCVLTTSFDKKHRGLWALCLLMLIATILPVGCGNSSVTKGPPPQNYMVTVTATSGALQHSTTVTVTVN